jgi:hypothetical protein
MLLGRLRAAPELTSSRIYTMEHDGRLIRHCVAEGWPRFTVAPCHTGGRSGWARSEPIPPKGTEQRGVDEWQRPPQRPASRKSETG